MPKKYEKTPATVTDHRLMTGSAFPIFWQLFRKGGWSEFPLCVGVESGARRALNLGGVTNVFFT